MAGASDEASQTNGANEAAVNYVSEQVLTLNSGTIVPSGTTTTATADSRASLFGRSYLLSYKGNVLYSLTTIRRDGSSALWPRTTAGVTSSPPPPPGASPMNTSWNGQRDSLTMQRSEGAMDRQATRASAITRPSQPMASAPTITTGFPESIAPSTTPRQPHPSMGIYHPTGSGYRPEFLPSPGSLVVADVLYQEHE